MADKVREFRTLRRFSPGPLLRECTLLYCEVYLREVGPGIGIDYPASVGASPFTALYKVREFRIFAREDPGFRHFWKRVGNALFGTAKCTYEMWDQESVSIIRLPLERPRLQRFYKVVEFRILRRLSAGPLFRECILFAYKVQLGEVRIRIISQPLKRPRLQWLTKFGNFELCGDSRPGPSYGNAPFCTAKCT